MFLRGFLSLEDRKRRAEVGSLLAILFSTWFDPLPNSTHKAQLRRISLETVAVTKEHLMKARWVNFCRAKKLN